jgi:protein involved in polysaccharide export with SLBB domain
MIGIERSVVPSGLGNFSTLDAALKRVETLGYFRVVPLGLQKRSMAKVNNAFVWRLVSVGVAIMAIAGCASHPKYSTRSSLQFEEGKILAVGDRFELEVRGRRVGEFTVGADGTIALPLIAHRVHVAGLTARQIAKVVSESHQPDGPRENEINVLPCFGSR